jgi:Tfp pilus assembly protein PilX
MHTPLQRTRPTGGRQERGVVLILAIIVLVAMSLAALALMRSVSSGNRVAGNLSFQQAATLAGDQGIEGAAAWLDQSRQNAKLYADIATSSSDNGYFASRNDPAAGQTWDQWWATLDATKINNLATDTSGNQVSYVIHRLCRTAGDPTTNIGCEVSAKADPSAGMNKTCCDAVKAAPVQYYYRITAKIAGNRGTSSYVQAIVAM